MKYQNPIIRGFHPDPSICRVGSDYYLVTSTFEYFPGIALFHSRDLVNWKQIGNCITRPGQLDYSKFKDSGGVWAPTIRYHKGRFYVTVAIDGMGNMIMHTDDINGEWSDPVWTDFGGIDPSICFDGDEAYYCTNDFTNGHEAIVLAKIDPDTGIRRKNAAKSGMVPVADGWKALMSIILETIIIFLRQRVELLLIIWRQRRAAKTFMAHMKIAHTIRFSPIKMIQQSKFSVQVMLIWWTMKMEIGGWFIWEHDRY